MSFVPILSYALPKHKQSYNNFFLCGSSMNFFDEKLHCNARSVKNILMMFFGNLRGWQRGSRLCRHVIQHHRTYCFVRKSCMYYCVQRNDAMSVRRPFSTGGNTIFLNVSPSSYTLWSLSLIPYQTAAQ